MKFKYAYSALLISVLAACGGGGGGSSPAPSTPVVTPPVVNPGSPAPTVAVSISQAKTAVGTPVTVSWSSTNATSCVGLDGMSGAKAINNSEQITPSKGGQYTYTISCDGAGGTAKQSVALVVPIPVQATSYLNAKNLNIPAQKYPELPLINGRTPGFTGGVAYGDFFGEGKISMVGFSNVWNPDGNNPAGKVYFYKFDTNGNPVDYTSSILSDVTGCEAPRKLLVADFNGDSKPDVYASCTGKEFPAGTGEGWTGEQTRILLSQPDGTYKNEATGFNCYCHTSAAADLNGDGKVDIITSNGLIEIASRGTGTYPSAVVVLTNDGTGHFTAKQDADYKVIPSKAFEMTTPDGSKGNFGSGNINTMELVPSLTGGTQPDLVIGAAGDATPGTANYSVPHWILKNNGNGTFSTSASFHAPGTFDNLWAIDINVIGSDVYMYGTNNGTGGNNGTYLYVNVFKYNVNTKAVTEIWNSGGKTWPQVIISPTDLIWLMPYNNTLVPYNATYGVTIPIQ